MKETMMRTRPNVTIVKASCHRNGIGGAPFYAVLFDDAEEGRMIASLFDEPAHCAVYKVAELAKDNVEFANGNSWRGDQYEAVLRPALKDFLQKNGTNRLGPFSFPQEPKDA